MRRGDVHTGLWWGDLKETSLGRPRRRLEHDIKMDIPKLEYGRLDKIALAQARDKWRVFVNAVMNYRVPKNAGNFLTS